MLANAELIAVKKSNTIDAKFSILIPSWNNLEYLKLCINSIRKNSAYKHQLIVHINEGKDGTLEWVKEQTDIDYSYSKKNIGVCYALNNCRQLVATDYILYINDDMYVCPNWDAFFVAEIEKLKHNYFFISGTSIEPNAQSNCMIEKDYGRDIHTFDEQKLLAEYESLAMNDWQGATWPPNVVHKTIWDLVGGYSTEFTPGMYSDPDFSMKLWQIGVRDFIGLSKSRVYHFGSKSVKRITKNPGYYKFISKWGITSSTLTTHYLKRGEKYSGTLNEPTIPFKVKAKNFIKRLRVAFMKL